MHFHIKQARIFSQAASWPRSELLERVNLLLPLKRYDNFEFWQVRLIMNLYRNTPDGSLSLNAIDHAWTTESWSIHTYAFINKGKVMFKSEMLQTVDPGVDRDLIDGLPCGKELEYLRDITCVTGVLGREAHSGTADLEHMFRCLLKDYWNGDNPAERPSREMWQFCPTCYTAYRIRIESLPSDPKMQSFTAASRNSTPFIINVTRISDYGEGKTPTCLQWRTATDVCLPITRRRLPPFEPWPVTCYAEADVLQAFADREQRETAHYAPFLWSFNYSYGVRFAEW